MKIEKHFPVLFSCCLIVILASCAGKTGTHKVLLVLPDRNFDEMQYVIYRAGLEDAGFEVDSAGISGKTAQGDKGLEIMPDLTLSSVRVENYSSMLLVDGQFPADLQGSALLKQLCMSFNESGKIIGGAGHSPLLLADFSVLKGKTAACWPSDSGSLTNMSVNYTGEITEISENVITGMGGSDDNLMEFVRKYSGMLNGKEAVSFFTPSGLFQAPGFLYYDEEKRFVMMHKNRIRTGTVFIPDCYDSRKKYSLVFVLHGTGGSGIDMHQRGFENSAGELDFIIVYPDGYNGDWDILPGGKTSFDDSGFFRNLISIFSKNYNIDSRRVYFTGHSLGAFMCYSLAYDMPDLISAIAPVSGLVYTPQNPKLRHADVSVLHQHAVDDYSVPFSNSTPFPDPLGAMDSLKFWRTLDGIDENYTSYSIRTGAEAFFWKGENGKADVELIKYENGGHSWPSGGTEEICDFFYNHPARENRIQFFSGNIKGYYDEGTTIEIPVAATHEENISHLKYYANGKLACENDSSPFACRLENLAPGRYRITAEAELFGGKKIMSGKSIQITVTRRDVARGCTVITSSEESVANKGKNLTDGDQYTRWSSAYSDNEYAEVDLGRIRTVSGAVLAWENAYASAYFLQVSRDGRKWIDVFSTSNGSGGTETISFTPVSARYVRMKGQKRATEWGYSLWDFMVTGE